MLMRSPSANATESTKSVQAVTPFMLQVIVVAEPFLKTLTTAEAPPAAVAETTRFVSVPEPLIGTPAPSVVVCPAQVVAVTEGPVPYRL